LAFKWHIFAEIKKVTTMKGKLFLAIATAMLGMALTTSCDKDEKEDNGENTATSLDGRWDGVFEESLIGQGEQRFTLIFDGSEVTVYIVAWGHKLHGTYTHENDSLKFSFDNATSYEALVIEQNSSGWSMADGALDPETLVLSPVVPEGSNASYNWYVMDEETFNMDVEFLSEFPFKIIGEGKATGSNMELIFIKR